ncbi:uncharacterized protein LOC133416136 [Phycodurus eques]|uniref:uncharacterized protein LOC133416136 n=1 Tax=Phycodurus eques TaxID=693459 RepID=UPI002ACD650D|nr:uncharacterized protein LOC133416136 [Phycodurus eques]
MKGPLLYAVIILRALLCGAQNNTSTVSTALAATPPEETSSAGAISPVPTSPAATPRLTSAVRSASKRNPLPDSTPSGAAAPVGVLDRRELLMLTGGLVLVCVILLLSTLMLICKVCQMSKRNKMLGGDAAKPTASDGKYKGNAETEAQETSMLLTNLSKTQEEVDRSDNPKEEGQKVRENGETGEGKQEAEEICKSQEAADVTPVDDSSFVTQQKDVDGPSANAAAAPSPDATEEPKNLV